MEFSVIIKRRKPGALSEVEERRLRLTQNLSPEERYIEELIDARESGRDDPFTSGSGNVARWYAKQLGMMIWIDGAVPTGAGPVQHLVGKRQHGFFQLYSLEQMEVRLQQIMKALRTDQLFICQANQPVTAGITYMRGLGTKTTVTNVTWAMNRAGKLIPQVHIEPTRIGNKVFNRVTGHNACFIMDNGIGPGAQLRVCQSGATRAIIDVVLATEEPGLPEFGTWRLSGQHAEPVKAEKTVDILRRALKAANIKGLTAIQIRKMVKAGIMTLSNAATVDLVPILGPILGPKVSAKVQSGLTPQ